MSLKKNAPATERPEKRLDLYLTDIFWVTISGLGAILGGMALMKKVLDLGQGLIIAYMVISSVAFLVMFWLHLWEIFRLLRVIKGQHLPQTEELETNKLGPAEARAPLEPAPSVTEDATRTFEPSSKEPVVR